MAWRTLDTSVLIRQWGNRGGSSPSSRHTVRDARRWAHELIFLHSTNAIVTPVYLEFIAGITSAKQMKLAEAFLAEFEIIDEGRVMRQDWEEATRLAKRVPRNSKRRQLGDCLIRAIANRLNYDVITYDRDFPS